MRANWNYFFDSSGLAAGAASTGGILKMASSTGTLSSIFEIVSFCLSGLPLMPLSRAKGNIKR
jgi:hypothetical protein